MFDAPTGICEKPSECCCSCCPDGDVIDEERCGAIRCHNMPCQLAVLKAQGVDGNDGVVCVCVCVSIQGRRGVVGGCEEFPVELIIPILTYETGGGGQEAGGVGCGCEQQAN